MAIHHVYGTSGSDAIWMHDGAQWIVGYGGADTLDGGNGLDTVDGGAGDDVLYAGDDANPDRLIGGSGNDLFWVNGPEDTVVEAAGQGTDTVIAKTSWRLGANLENLTLQEKGALANGYAIGNDLDNRLIGNSGHNVLDGRAGNDSIGGGAGNDTIWAGNGNDRADGGPGHDRIDGGNGIDTLSGGTGNDTLYAGDDRLADTLAGGAGNDVYWVNGTDDIFAPKDTVQENADGGVDTVVVKGSWKLTPNVEKLILQETGSATRSTVRGNELANHIQGASGLDFLNGDDGNDTIAGLGGQDDVWGENGNDVLYGNDGDDYLNGGYGNDLMIGGDGDDGLGAHGMYQLSGAGRDTMIGGTGNDALDGGGAPGRFGSVDFDDAPDLFLFAREGNGFGHDTIQGFNDENDRIELQGYTHADLAGPVVVANVTPYTLYPDAMSWTADLAFKDGSTLSVTGVSHGAPSFTEGADFVFRAGGTGQGPAALPGLGAHGTSSARLGGVVPGAVFSPFMTG